MMCMVHTEKYISTCVAVVGKRAKFSSIWTANTILCTCPVQEAVKLRNGNIQFSSVDCSFVGKGRYISGLCVEA